MCEKLVGNRSLKDRNKHLACVELYCEVGIKGIFVDVLHF